MSEAHAGGWKARMFEEFRGYWLNVLYLALVFGAFVQYRRWILASHEIDYENYLMGLIKAMVLAKVIMLGDALRLARGMDRRPLIWPTLYKAVVFSLFLVAFTFLEHGVKGWWTGDGFVGGVKELAEKGADELLGSTLVIFVSLIPFFAFREIGRVMGRGRLLKAFFVERPGEAR